MTGDDTYTPENDLNLADDLTSPDDTYTPENDLNLSDDLGKISAVFDEVVTTASATASGQTIGITGISTAETTEAAILASGATQNISGGSTGSTQEALATGAGASTQIDASQTEKLDVAIQAEVQATGSTAGITASVTLAPTAANAALTGDTVSLSGGTTAIALTSTATLTGQGSTIDLAQKEIFEVTGQGSAAGVGEQATVSGTTTASTTPATASTVAETIQLDQGQKETFEVPIKAEIQSTGEQTSISGTTSPATTTANATAAGVQTDISGSTTLNTLDSTRVSGTPTPVYREVINFEDGVIQDDTNVVGNELQQFGNEDNINVQSQDVISGNFSLGIVNDGDSTDEGIGKTAIDREMDVFETSFKSDGVSEITVDSVFGSLVLRYEPPGKGDQITITDTFGFDTTKTIISGVSESTVYDVRFEFTFSKEEATVTVNGNSTTISFPGAEEVSALRWKCLTDNKTLLLDDISLELFEDVSIRGTTTASSESSEAVLTGLQEPVDGFEDGDVKEWNVSSGTFKANNVSFFDSEFTGELNNNNAAATLEIEERSKIFFDIAANDSLSNATFGVASYQLLKGGDVVANINLKKLNESDQIVTYRGTTLDTWKQNKVYSAGIEIISDTEVRIFFNGESKGVFDTQSQNASGNKIKVTQEEVNQITTL